MKEEQIKDEIILTVKKAIGVNSYNTEDDNFLIDSNDIDHIAEQTAEIIYNAGYRKTFTSIFVSNPQRAFKEGYVKGIEEQKAEIERLTEVNKAMENDIYNNEMNLQNLLNEIAELKAENERLTEKLRQVLLSIDTVKEMNTMCNIDEQRKQAVKEFVEKLQKELPCRDYTFNGNTYSMILTSSTKYVIDKLLKEYENEN